MNREESALLAAIRAHPADDTPRLVYADWLQEHERAEEAEFIRIGCRLETAPPDAPDYTELLARQQELALWLTRHVFGPHPKFAAGLELPGGIHWWLSSRRGFPRYFEFDGDLRPGLKVMRALGKALEKAFAKIPTRMLTARFITVPQLAEFLKQPVVEQLDALTIQLRTSESPQERVPSLIADCSRLRNLRRLVLAFEITPEGFATLAASKHLGGLNYFSVDESALELPAFRALTVATWFHNLQALDLGGYLTAESFEEMCRGEPFPRLHTLTLSGHQLSVAAWQAFGRSRAFPSLSRLELQYGDLSNGQVAALAAASWFRPAYLDFRSCGIGNAGAMALASAPWLGSLRWLGLESNLIGPAGVESLARSKHLTGLKHLDLSYNSPGAAGLRAITANRSLRGLQSLLLGGYGEHSRKLTSAHFHEFLSKLDMPQLRHLALTFRPVGSKATRLLAEDRFQSLTRLDLRGCKVTDTAAAALLASPALQNLVQLDLSANQLCEGLRPLTEAGTMPRLSDCRVSSIPLTMSMRKLLDRHPGVIV